MGIVQNTPRKQGKINPHPHAMSIQPRIFGPRGAAGANVGNVTNPGNPANLTAAGIDYNSQIAASDPGGTIHPLGNHSDTATQLYMPPLVANGTTQVVTQDKAVDVAPHEKGVFFTKKHFKTSAQRVSGGVDPNSNTPFHPRTATIDRPSRHPQQPGERKFASSFLMSGPRLTGVAQQDRLSPPSRWAHTKQGAADAKVPHHGTLAGSKGGTIANNPRATVATNAHSGSPYVVPWIPQPRGVQPNEKGTTFPVQQPCSGLKGC